MLAAAVVIAATVAKPSNITAAVAIAAEATILLANVRIHLAAGYGKITVSAKAPAAMSLEILVQDKAPLYSYFC